MHVSRFGLFSLTISLIDLGLPTIRQAPFTVNPGDSFISKFWFNSENGTEFGIGSYEEMNKAVFLYYPAKKLLRTAPWACTYDIPVGVCNASMSSRVLTSTNDFERIFGGVPSSCQARVEPTTGNEDTSMGHERFQASWYVTAFGASLVMCWFLTFS